MHDFRTTLRRLALRDDRFIERLLTDECTSAATAELAPRERALVQLGALIALDAAPPSYMSAAQAALRLAGAAPRLQPLQSQRRFASVVVIYGFAGRLDAGIGRVAASFPRMRESSLDGGLVRASAR